MKPGQTQECTKLIRLINKRIILVYTAKSDVKRQVPVRKRDSRTVVRCGQHIVEKGLPVDEKLSVNVVSVD